MAVDLLAQAEHDETAQAILITDDPALAEAVARAVDMELHSLTRPEAAQSWRDHGCIIVVRDWTEGAALTDQAGAGAPAGHGGRPRTPVRPHPPLRRRLPRPDCPEALGDYVAGPNHVLPTGRTARFASGLSVYDFLKRTTWVHAGRRVAGPHRPGRGALAEAEGLQAHARSVAMRLGQSPHA